MSVKAISWAFEQNVTPSAAKFVLVALANYGDQQGYCYPSQEMLAKDTGQSDRSVRSHLIYLEERGLIRRERRSNRHGHRMPDAYWLVWATALPEESSTSLPETSSARDESLPEEFSEPTGRIFQTLPEESSTLLKELNRHSEPSVNRQSIAAGPPQRARDIHWDEMAEVFGFSPTPKTPEHGRWNKAAAIWRQMNAPPGMIRRAAERYMQEYPRMDFNALAVASHAEKLLRTCKPETPPSIDDIKSPMIRSLLRMTEEDMLDARPDHLPVQDGITGRIAAAPRRLGPGV